MSICAECLLSRDRCILNIKVQKVDTRRATHIISIISFAFFVRTRARKSELGGGYIMVHIFCGVGRGDLIKKLAPGGPHMRHSLTIYAVSDSENKDSAKTLKKMAAGADLTHSAT
jgi:hypothetical protein